MNRQLAYLPPMALILAIAVNAWVPNRVDNQLPTPSIRLAAIFRQAADPNETSFYSNPLTLDGKPLDYDSFSIASKGLLAVVTGNPASPEATRIPFRVYLKRDEQQLIHGVANGDQPLYEVAIDQVLAIAKPGDHLIIEPVRKSDWRGKRIIKVVDYGAVQRYKWFPLLSGSADRC